MAVEHQELSQQAWVHDGDDDGGDDHDHNDVSTQAGVDVEMLGLLRILCFILITSPPGKNNCHYLCLCRLHFHHHHHYQHHCNIYYPSPQVLLLMCRATPGDRNKWSDIRLPVHCHYKGDLAGHHWNDQKLPIYEDEEDEDNSNQYWYIKLRPL